MIYNDHDALSLFVDNSLNAAVQVPLINLIRGIKLDSPNVRSKSENKDSISIVAFPSATRFKMSLQAVHVTKGNGGSGDENGSPSG